MSAGGFVTLRAALEDAAHEAGRTLDAPLVVLGRALLREASTLETVTLDSSEQVAGGLAWGALTAEQRTAWLARVPVGAVAAQVVARERAGARGLIDRVMLLPTRERPLPLEDVCTSLFVGGVRALRVIDLEPLRNLVAVIGRRAF